MSGMLRKGMSWLGLGPEDEFDDYDYEYGDDVYDDDVEPIRQPAPRAAARQPVAPMSPVGTFDDSWDDLEPGGIRVLPVSSPSPEPARSRGVVRPLPSAMSARPQLVAPTNFNDAQEVGDLFKRRQPVILNLQGLDRELVRRLLDFASGVAYGLDGSVERVASSVYLLSPADVEVSASDRRRIEQGDFEI